MANEEVPDLLVLVDVETTGLDDRIETILELGIAVYNKKLELLHEKTWYVKDDGWEGAFDRAKDIVKEMHTKSGLLHDLKTLPENYRAEDGQLLSYRPSMVSYLAWRWLTEDLGLEANKYPMVGSSVLLDRRFVMRHMTVLDAFFHYRCIDVSSVKELCKVFRPDIYARMSDDPRFDKANATHRPLDDIRATIEQLRFFIGNGFLVVPALL